ncbi:MAG: translation initiation factor IF-2 subunit beta, partial [Candidatus Bathyarchaeota archaeon]|nr:translation initiation factor IF-2 subunit beta [Candidatus Bathyarchaeota archaeon]
MALDYEKMQDEAHSELPQGAFKHERFEVPRPSCTVHSSRMVFHIFKEVCNALNRDPLHVLKFLSKEMATARAADGTRAVFQGKFESATFERLIMRYLDRFVTCSVCKRPD